nr:reverse transcriptase domain-containing protein [Tanacetum cinerariifolium]
MGTRSSARNLFPPLDNPELTIQIRSRVDPTLLNDFEMATDENGDPPVPDLRTMKELCQPTLNGRGGPITPTAIQATNFGLKNDMIQQVQNSCQFHGLPSDDANKHLDKFLHVTESTKVNGVTDDALRLYLFPYSLTHHATAWFDRLPRNSINTFVQMAKMFLGKYFPPSMATKLINEITNFRQRPDESLFEAWERGTFMKRRPEECYDLIKNTTAHHNDWDTLAKQSESSSSIPSSFDSKIVALKAEMAKINKNLMKVLQINQQVKAVAHNCETYGGPHSYNDCPATVGQTQNVYAAGAYQGGNSYQPQGSSHGQNPHPAYQAPAYQALGYQAPIHQPLIPQPQVVTTTEFTNYMKENDAILKNIQTNMTSLANSNLELKNMFGQFMKMNTASSSGSGTLPSNTITNPKEDFKGITTRSGNAYQRPMISTTSSSLPQVVERETEVTKDTVPPTNNGSTKDVQPPVVQVEIQVPNSEPVVAPVAEPVVAPGIDECLALADLGASINLMLLSVWNKLFLPELTPTLMTLELANRSISRPIGVTEDIGRALIDVYAGELTLRVNNEAVKFNLDQTSRYSANYNDMTANRIDVIDWLVRSILKKFSFPPIDLLLEEVDAFLALEDDPTSPKVDHSYYDTEGDILLLEAFLTKNDKSSINEPTEVELKDLPPHFEYAFFEGDDMLPVIIAKDLSVEEKAALIKVLKSHKRAIAWKLFDIKGINLEFCTYKILREDDFKPVVQHQIKVNLKIHNVIKKEVKKLLNAGLIYPISDSPWVSLVHCVPKKGGFTVVENEENELIPTRLITRWRVCIEYRKLNEATHKDHFPLPFMDQILKRLAGNEYYCFLDGAVQGQCHEKNFRPIHYASKTMIEAESHYTTTEKEMLAVVYAFEKFQSYVILNKSIVYTDHSALKYLFAKKDSKARLLRDVVPAKDVKHYFWDDPFLFKICADQVIRRERFRNEMKCLKIPSKFARFLTFGASISRGRSRLYEGTSIYSWPSIACRNGLKRKRSPPMTPELFANS